MRRATSWLVLGLLLLLLLPVPGPASAAAESKEPGEESGSAQEQPADALAPPRLDPGELAQRALEIEAREAALRELEASVRRQIDELERLQREALLVLEPEREQRESEVAKLVAFYQNMKPKSAAELLEKLPLTLATQVLSRMKQREAGKILNVMNDARAVQISRRMAGTEQ